MLFNFMNKLLWCQEYHRIYLYKLGAEKFSIGSVICTEISWRVILLCQIKEFDFLWSRIKHNKNNMIA